MPGLQIHQASVARRKSAPPASYCPAIEQQTDVSTLPQVSGKKRKRKSCKLSEDRFGFPAKVLRLSPHLGLELKEEVALSNEELANPPFHSGSKEKRKEEMRNEERNKKRKEGKSLQSIGNGNACNSRTLSEDPLENEKKSLLEWVERDLQLRSNCSGIETGQEGRAAGIEDFVNGYEDAYALKCSLQQEDGVLRRTIVNGLKKRGKTRHHKKRKENDRVLQYVLKRCVVVSPSLVFDSHFRGGRTTRTDVDVWGEQIPVTLTNEASVVEEWILRQSGGLFGLDIEWRPGRVKGLYNKVALLQLCGENECLIVQMLFLDRNPESLKELLFDPTKNLAGVGVHSDSKRLLQDHGLLCQGEIELTTLAVQRLKRQELKHVGLKALVWEVLGLDMKKSKRVTLSNWAKRTLDRAQVEYACIDAWVSFAISRKLMALC